MAAKRRVLIVDDNVMISRLLKSTLEGTGSYQVLVENEPRRACLVARDFRPDIVLLDVIMPEMDGGTVASKMRQDPDLKDTPVIFLTSILGKDEAVAKGGMIGDDPVLAKPVTATELLAAIDKALNR